jgi:hypothetical protein
MIKLKSLLKEQSEMLIGREEFKKMTELLKFMYKHIWKLEHGLERQGEFLKVYFTDYTEAEDFYNSFLEMLGPYFGINKKYYVDYAASCMYGPKRYAGTIYYVSYKIYKKEK